MRKVVAALLLVMLCGSPTFAQISVPNTFVTGARILASEMNANFDALESNALNRDGGTIIGNISVSSGITIDGVDVGAILGGSGTPTFSSLTVTNNSSIGGTENVVGNFSVNTNKFTVAASTGNTLVAGTLDVTSTLAVGAAADFAAGAQFGSGNVSLITSTGKLAGLSSTYLNDLDGTALTGVAKLASTNTFTGRNDLKGYTELKSTANPSASAITYDLSAGTHFETALTGNATVTISNVPNPTNGVVSFTVKFTNDGTPRTFTWPASVKWVGGTAIDFTDTNNRVDFATFISYDAGTTWYGFIGGLNFQ